MITLILAILTFEFQNVRRKSGGDGGPCRMMTHRVVHQLIQVWQIKHGQKRRWGSRIWPQAPWKGCVLGTTTYP
jgi:hypothetical protein